MTTGEPMAGGAAAEPSESSEAVDATLAAIHLVTKAVTAYGREDLAARIAAARQRLEDPAFRVLVVGEFKQGKSSLVNALLNTSVCPVDDDIATSAPTAVGFADPPTARVLYSPMSEDPDAEPDVEEIPVDRIREYVTEAANPANERRVQWVEVGVPSPMLEDGLVFVDTPGVGGLGSVHGAITAAALPTADGVLFLSDASQEFSEPEMTFLKQAISLCPNVCCVVTKIDFYPAWRKIVDLDQGHLAEAKIATSIISVSSTLRTQALELGDPELDEESGFPQLIETLRAEIVGDGERRGVAGVCAELLTVTDQLQAQFNTEEAALKAPEDAGPLREGLERANQRAEQLHSQAARWAVTLADGIGDLTSDVDHDLRGRLRQITKEADEVIDNDDPVEIWAEFEPWLYRRSAEDVVNNFRFLQTRAEELSAQVAEHFALDSEAAVYHPDLGGAGASLRRESTEAHVDFSTMGKGQKAMTGVRGGYMGVLMFGALGSMVGLAIGALPVAAGLMMGRKALRDEETRQITMRRQNAKNAIRKYLDEASFLSGKESRDTLRRVQRQLRDHYTTRADELQRSVNESKQAAAQAVQADQQTRTKRLKDVQAEIQRIAMLRKQIVESRDLALASAPTS
ncbi:MAG: dynamin family protein [Acidimicrobiia bacterium]